MKFTLDWLKDHLETDEKLDDILSALTDLGLEVEKCNNPTDHLKEFVVGEISAIEKHPNADRLKVCTVLTDKGEQQIICGAPNARQGIKVVVAHPGTYVPGIDTTIKIGNIRGVESQGMMCSERELMLSDEHDGIIELVQEAEVGQKYINFADHLDVSIEIGITPNRPDALGVRGIARDLAAKGIGKLKNREIHKITGEFSSPISVNIEPGVSAKACPLFIGRYIRGVRNRESPKWLKDRLLAIGLRPISALVDITNYFTFDQARPLHVFDASKLTEELTVRKAKGGELITALDGLDYILNVNDTVISSGSRIESIAGVIGGMNSGCNLDTQDVFLESAYFDPVSIAMTGRKLKINSDARFRFERGVDPHFTRPGIELATRLILEVCGGSASEIVIAGDTPKSGNEIILRPERVESLIGISIDKKDQLKILKGLGFLIRERENKLVVSVPSWRPDVLGEADLVEEIIRVISLSKLEGKPLKKNGDGVSRPILTPHQRRVSTIRRRIAGVGLNECISYSFIDEGSAKLFLTEGDLSILTNPISSEMSHMRPSLLPGLCQAAKRNQSRSYNDLKLFEVGEVFYGSEPGQQKTHASGILLGNYYPKNSYGSQRPVDAFDSKKVAELVMFEMGITLSKLSLSRGEVPGYYHPGRSAAFKLGPKNVLCFFGELHPKIMQFYELKGPLMGFEIFLENAPYPKNKKLARNSLKLSEFQSVERDFAFVVPVDCEVDAIRRAILASAKEIIVDARLFDVFEGEEAEKQLGQGSKSAAFTVRLLPAEATFTDKEIDKISSVIISNVKNTTGGLLRS